MKLGVTGTSGLVTMEQERTLWRLFTYVAVTELHHGDCIGADAAAHEAMLGSRSRVISDWEVRLPPVKIIIHPPDNDKKRAFCQDYDEIREPLPYLVRNQSIVNEVDLLIAVPRTAKEELRSGTWATVRYMREAKKPVIIIDSDGGWHLDGTGVNS